MVNKELLIKIRMNLNLILPDYGCHANVPGCEAQYEQYLFEGI